MLEDCRGRALIIQPVYSLESALVRVFVSLRFWQKYL